MKARAVSALLAATLGLLMASLTAPAPATSGPAAAVPPPNIVLITTDDQRLTDLAWMPQTLALLGGDQGVTFTEGLSPHPLCCPARAEILTGQYAQNNGVRSNTGLNGGYQALRQPDNTIGAWLQAAGYRTALVGKMLNHYSFSRDGTPDGWDYWDPTIGKVYFYDAFIQARNGNPTEYQDAYITDYIAAETEALIQNYSAGDQPFFIWASHIAPHGSIRDDSLGGPPIPSPAYAGRYADVPSTSLAVPSFNEPHNQDKPRELARLEPVDREKVRTHFSRRLESLASVDDAVAGTVAALRDAGVLDNTLLIFTSDNGFLLGEHRYMGKIYAFEESVRVPFLMRGPGVAAGVSTDQVVTTVDIAATLLEAAGASPGRLQDGISFLHVGTSPATDRLVLVQAGNGQRQTRAQPGWLFRGVRNARYTYTQWRTGEQELYDRDVDPFELSNRATWRRYAWVTRTLRQRTHRLSDCAGEACRVTGPSLR